MKIDLTHRIIPSRRPSVRGFEQHGTYHICIHCIQCANAPTGCSAIWPQYKVKHASALVELYNQPPLAMLGERRRGPDYTQPTKYQQGSSLHTCHCCSLLLIHLCPFGHSCCIVFCSILQRSGIDCSRFLGARHISSSSLMGVSKCDLCLCKSKLRPCDILQCLCGTM